MYKRIKKKIIAFTLALAMLSGMLPMSVSQAAEEGTSVDTQMESVEESVGETSDADSQTAEETDSTVPLEETEESSQTSAADTASEPQLQYLYVETPYLYAPASQKIAVSFQEGMTLSGAALTYENETTAEQYTVQAGEVQDSTALFTIAYEEASEAASYHLLSVSAVVNDVAYDIDLNAIGIDSRYGVNQECDTQPDAVVVEEEETASVRSAEVGGVSASFMTIDEDGELEQSDSVETAIAEAETEVPKSSARSLDATEKSGNLVVALDPGHGGSDGGASANGLVEKNLTLQIAKYCKAELEQYSGVTVYMTRSDDRYLGLKERVDNAAANGANVFVSIHINSATVSSANGAEVYYPNANYISSVHAPGMNLAQQIQDELVALGLYDRGIDVRNTVNDIYPDGSKQDYYGVIRYSKLAGFPGIIVEHAFISNPSDAAKLAQDSFLRQLGIADAKGIADAYGLTKGKWEKVGQSDWKWDYGDGTYAKDTWEYINGKWYYFGNDSLMLKGWQDIGSARYYLDPVNGDMKIGWVLLDQKWYYFNASGAMVSNGWTWVGDSCYYFDDDGVMAADAWIGDYYVNSSGAWVQGWVKPGWFQSGDRWWYRHRDGGYTISNWELIDGSWYYFDAAGWRVTGWQLVGSTWYYMDSDGKMQTGWLEIGGNKYYLSGSGAMQIGWQLIGGEWYYFNSSGAMETDTWVGECYVDENGVWDTTKFLPKWILSGNRWWYRHEDGGYTRSDWEQIAGQWYYFDDAGWMVTGWLKLDDTWYYTNASGCRTTGWQLIGNVWYYMDSDGKMVTGWKDIGGSRYYLSGSGAMVTGWQEIEGEYYYFSGSGAMAADTWIGDYYVDENGVRDDSKVKPKWIQSGNRWWYRHGDGSYTKDDWEQIAGQWYYFDADGWMVTGWKEIDGEWHYFQTSGAMLTNAWVGNYYVDASGVMATDTWIGDYYVDASGLWVPGKDRSGWVQSGDKWWYRHSDGGYTTSNWEFINGQWYYFDAAGWMMTGWIFVGSDYYYMDASGAMHKGWLEEGGNDYYLNPTGNSYGPEGAMATGYREIDGTWYYFSKGQSPVGALYYTGVTPIMGISLLGNDKETAVDKMVLMYVKSGRTYPSEALGEGGAPDIETFCEILYDEAVIEGVKPEVVFAQAMLETGYLQFGGDVQVGQFNFAGLGATGGGVPGHSFDSVAEGLRAQVQHLKAYASDQPLNQACVDPRFDFVTRNTAPYVEWLGINENPYGRGWAASLRYGINLVQLYMEPMYLL